MQMTNIFRKELNTFSISADNREVLSWFLNAYSKFKAESLDSNLNYKTELCTLSSLYFLNKMLFVFFPVLRLALQVQKQQWMLLFSRSVVSDFLQPHGLQHTSPPCPLPSPGVGSDSCPLHWWCHLAISSFDALLSFCPQTFPASGTFPMSWLFTSNDQNTGTSASVSVLSMSVQGLFPLRLTGLISLLSKGLSGLFSSTTVRRHQFFGVMHSLRFSSHSHTLPLGRP